MNTYISLFSSAGIGCFGFKSQGFECIATNEILDRRLEIQKYNNKCRYESGYISGDISTPNAQQHLFAEIDRWEKEHSIDSVDVIIATPPCQGMSVANHKKNQELERNSLVVESIKLTKKILPKFFVFENVRSFLTTICRDIDNTEKTIEESIRFNLGGHYNIYFKVVNFKNYGANSSRTRTLVIGVRKDILNVAPYDLFPNETKPKTLREMFKNLPPLKSMGEISDDIYHASRSFDKKMLPWIEKLKEGQSAFDNEELKRIPHNVVNGKIVKNKNKNGDKYARWYWDKEGPCIHTRNDALPSQSTIHPSENRVFSVREVMLMMSVPAEFKWAENPESLNDLCYEDKVRYLKKEELNIRRCLGESVPTAVFTSIAKNIRLAKEKTCLSLSAIKSLNEKYGLDEFENISEFIKRNFSKYSLSDIFLIAEYCNADRENDASFYTRSDICFSVVNNLPDLKAKKKIRILEPSVGVGNFLPALFKKYADKEEVILDVCDINPNSLKLLKIILAKIGVPTNFKINYHNEDFLLWKCGVRYDVVVGNPPFKKMKNGDDNKLGEYKMRAYNKNTTNIAAFFVEKSLMIGNFVSLIVPKAMLNSPEYDMTRDLLLKYEIERICDFGESAFKGVKIETMSLSVSSKYPNEQSIIIIESYIKQTIKEEKIDYVCSKQLPYWVIYRNKEFDAVKAKMNLDIFSAFRDRQITKRNTQPSGEIRVLKSRNIGSNQIKDCEDADCYIENLDGLSVSKYLNSEGVVMVPNLSYAPRASFLPNNAVADGSVALLTLKNGSRPPQQEDLEFYSTDEFREYYRIARNHGTRSLNIDRNSVFFFGLLKDA